MKPEHLSLGGLIAALESHDPDTRLAVGFTNPHSYRGYYEQLAFGIAENVTVGEMLTDARSALGETFQGWKGGDYEMDEDTPVWLVSERGTSDGETVGAVLLDLMLANTMPPDGWSEELVAAMQCPWHSEHFPHTPEECARMRAEDGELT